MQHHFERGVEDIVEANHECCNGDIVIENHFGCGVGDVVMTCHSGYFWMMWCDVNLNLILNML